MQNSDENQHGDGMLAGSASSYRDQSTSLSRPMRSPPTLAPYGTASWIQAQRNPALAYQVPIKALQSSPTMSLNSPSHPTLFNRQASRPDTYAIILQPNTRPISQEQLVAEVKGIYAGLVMDEAKCIEVDNKHARLAQANQLKLNSVQWQAFIALHRTLLHEHYDFFLASQHSFASPALRRLASKYAMPARMWRHGIHSFLELLRHCLPISLDYMLQFIYLAYSMIGLLYETVPVFEDTWIECLGDLSRYRMAIEDDDVRDREVWTGVARHWYSKASNNAPTTGRLYHHQAILARPNALQQLFYYSKSLCIAIPFTSARESILTLFEPILNSNRGQGQYRLPPLERAFVKAHGLLFTNKNIEEFEPAMTDFLSLLDNQIGRVTRKFMEQGYHIAMVNSVAILGFASKDNVLIKAISTSKVDNDTELATASEDLSQSIIFKLAQQLSNSTLKIVLQRIGDPNVLPFIHATLVWIQYLSSYPSAITLVQAEFPWNLLATMLNTLLISYKTPACIENESFPLPYGDNIYPFPEDYAMRGLLWTENYFPDEWFSRQGINEEDKYREVASMTEQRKERILWLGCCITRVNSSIKYDGERFSVPTGSVGKNAQA